MLREQGKLRANWEGPYRIQKMIGPNACILQMLQGESMGKTWNLNHLKLYYPPQVWETNVIIGNSDVNSMWECRRVVWWTDSQKNACLFFSDVLILFVFSHTFTVWKTRYLVFGSAMRYKSRLVVLPLARQWGWESRIVVLPSARQWGWESRLVVLPLAR